MDSEAFASAVRRERLRLAQVDPIGELDAVRPLVDEAMETLAREWQAGLQESLARAGFATIDEYMDAFTPSSPGEGRR